MIATIGSWAVSSVYCRKKCSYLRRRIKYFLRVTYAKKSSLNKPKPKFKTSRSNYKIKRMLQTTLKAS